MQRAKVKFECGRIQAWRMSIFGTGAAKLKSEGCGKQLVTEDGRFDYRRHFCGCRCKNEDIREAK